MSNRGRVLPALNGTTFVLLLAIATIAVVITANEVQGSATHDPSLRYPSLVICEVFGDRYCGPALRVAWCESRFDTRATNGQYRGLFQMGRWERRTFGHGSTARAQARAAHRYFVKSGRDWSPWECKPWGSR